MECDLILSGGSARGLLECAGALAAVVDYGYRPVRIAGTSGGAIVAGHYAVCENVERVKEFVVVTDFTRFVNVGYWSWLRLLFLDYLSNGKALGEFLAEATERKKFSDLKVDVSLVASGIETMAPKVFSKANTPDLELWKAMRASSAMPYAFKPMRLGDTLYDDGSIFSHFPVDLFEDHPRPTVAFLIGRRPEGGRAVPRPQGKIERVENYIARLVDGNVFTAIRCAPDGIKMAVSDGLGHDTLKFDFSYDQKQALWHHGYDLMKRALEAK